MRETTVSGWLCLVKIQDLRPGDFGEQGAMQRKRETKRSPSRTQPASGCSHDYYLNNCIMLDLELTVEGKMQYRGMSQTMGLGLSDYMWMK